MTTFLDNPEWTAWLQRALCALYGDPEEDGRVTHQVAGVMRDLGIRDRRTASRLVSGRESLKLSTAVAVLELLEARQRDALPALIREAKTRLGHETAAG